MRGYYGSPENVIAAIDEQFDEAIVKVIDFAGGEVAEFDEGFFVFAVAFDEIVFGVADSGDFGISINYANKTFVVDLVFGFIDDVIGQV